MRIGFVTCVRLGLECMEAVAATGGHFDLALTLRDDLAPAKSGRVTLDRFCEEHRTPLCKVRNINDPDAIERIRDARLDWLLIIGWSQIARLPVLEAARHGALGIHPTFLPEGRGRASIPWAILKGLKRTGVTLFKLDEGIDTGPIVRQTEIPIAADETATTLYARIALEHRRILVTAWPDLLADRVQLVEQDHARATSWPGRRPEDGRLKAEMTVNEAATLVRAVTHPYPGAFFDHGTQRVRVWSARAEARVSPEVNLRTANPAIPFQDGSLALIDWQFEEPG